MSNLQVQRRMKFMQKVGIPRGIYMLNIRRIGFIQVLNFFKSDPILPVIGVDLNAPSVEPSAIKSKKQLRRPQQSKTTVAYYNN